MNIPHQLHTFACFMITGRATGQERDRAALVSEAGCGVTAALSHGW